MSDREQLKTRARRCLLTNMAMSHGDMSALFACFVETGRHVDDLVKDVGG